MGEKIKVHKIAERLTEHHHCRFAKGSVSPKKVRPRWTHLGSCEVFGSVCTWRCDLAARREEERLWSIRWRGEEQEEEILGPDHLDSLAEELVEERNLEREDLLRLFASSRIRELRDFSQDNQGFAETFYLVVSLQTIASPWLCQ